MELNSMDTESYQLRFKTSSGRSFITKKELELAFTKFNSQIEVSKYFSVSQMTISRAKIKLNINHDGKVLANNGEAKRNQQSEYMKKKYLTGELIPPWLGKKQSAEVIENRVSKIRGKPSWNAGKAKKIKHECLACGKEFVSQSDKRILCSAGCTAEYMKNLYCDGRFSGKNNPNYGNGLKTKKAWKAGKYKNRPLTKETRGKGGRYKGIWMRSSYELQYAEHLDKKKIIWEYESKKFYLVDGRSYTPDFYIKKLNLYIEVKGYWWPSAFKKFNQFLSEYPHIQILIEKDNKSWII